LDLEKYLAEIQLPGNISVSFSQYHRVLLRVLEWLALGDFHHIIQITNAATADSSLQLSIFSNHGHGTPF
jgi:hypothetical protein